MPVSKKFEMPLACRFVFLDHLGSGDVGWHEIRRELDPVKSQVECFGEG